MRALRFFTALKALSHEQREALVDRDRPRAAEVATATAEIVAQVRAGKDAALFALAERFDGVRLESLEVPRHRIEAALARTAPPIRRALERASQNIARAHEAQRPAAVEVETEPGVRVGRRPEPLARVGVYAPGGRAAYPSSVLMGAVPAKVAGVGEVLLCTPPGRDGAPSEPVLAAAAIAGVDRVFAVGGPGAIAAMAFGTQSVPRVQRIVGPGNAYVAEAKRQVQGVVAIDSPAGPSELLVVADGSADAKAIARELLAQAEHDADAAVIALVDGQALAASVAGALEALLSSTCRRDVAAAALAARGAVLWLESTDEAWPFVEAYAPEHLLLATANPPADLLRVRNAGTVFLGPTSSVAFGDYLTGSNHVLPTAGAARCYSGLSLLDFYRWTSWQEISRDAAARLAEDTALLAAAEGLLAHADAAIAWKEVSP